MALKTILNKLWYVGKLIGIAVLLAVFLRIFVFDSFLIPGSSMEPTIFG